MTQENEALDDILRRFRVESDRIKRLGENSPAKRKYRIAVIGLGGDASIGSNIAYTLHEDSKHDDTHVEKVLFTSHDATKGMHLESNIGEANSRDYQTLEKWLFDEGIDIAIIAAGKMTGSREDEIEANLPIVRDLAEKFRGFTGLTLMLTNPVDIFSYYFSVMSGCSPNSVVGINPDVERGIYLLAEMLNKRGEYGNELFVDKLTTEDISNFFTIGAHERYVNAEGEDGMEKDNTLCMIPYLDETAIGKIRLLGLIKDPEFYRELQEMIAKMGELQYKPEMFESEFMGKFKGLDIPLRNPESEKGKSGILTASKLIARLFTERILPAIADEKTALSLSAYLPKRGYHAVWPVRFSFLSSVPLDIDLKGKEHEEPFNRVCKGFLERHIRKLKSHENERLRLSGETMPASVVYPHQRVENIISNARQMLEDATAHASSEDETAAKVGFMKIRRDLLEYADNKLSGGEYFSRRKVASAASIKDEKKVDEVDLGYLLASAHGKDREGRSVKRALKYRVSTAKGSNIHPLHSTEQRWGEDVPQNIVSQFSGISCVSDSMVVGFANNSAQSPNPESHICIMDEDLRFMRAIGPLSFHITGMQLDEGLIYAAAKDMEKNGILVVDPSKEYRKGAIESQIGKRSQQKHVIRAFEVMPVEGRTRVFAYTPRRVYMIKEKREKTDKTIAENVSLLELRRVPGHNILLGYDMNDNLIVMDENQVQRVEPIMHSSMLSDIDVYNGNPRLLVATNEGFELRGFESTDELFSESRGEPMAKSEGMDLKKIAKAGIYTPKNAIILQDYDGNLRVLNASSPTMEEIARIKLEGTPDFDSRMFWRPE